MISVETQYVVLRAARVGDNMSSLHDRVRGDVASYPYMIGAVKLLEKKDLLQLKKKGRDMLIVGKAKVACHGKLLESLQG